MNKEMEMPESPDIVHTTPKRKRDDQDSTLTLPNAPSPIRLKTTDLPCRSLGDTTSSPRTIAAGRFQNLDLEEQALIPQLDFCQRPEAQMDVPAGTLETKGFNPQISLRNRSFNALMTPPPSSSGPSILEPHKRNEENSTHLALEIPEAPSLRAISSPASPSAGTELKVSPPNTPLSSKLWWNDTEITGHNPNDPSDDGYGINGIGFLPTPAIANARAHKRKKQVADWKNREAREARQKRSDRRRRKEAEAGPLNNGIESGDSGTRADETRRVRFLEA